MIKRIKEKKCNSCDKIIYWIKGIDYPFDDREGMTPHNHGNEKWW